MIKGDQCCTAYEFKQTSVTLCGRWTATEVPSWINGYGGYQFTCTDNQIRAARSQLLGANAMTLATSASTAAAALYFTA